RLDDPHLGSDPGNELAPRRESQLIQGAQILRVHDGDMNAFFREAQRDGVVLLGEIPGNGLNRARRDLLEEVGLSVGHSRGLREGPAERLLVQVPQLDQIRAEMPSDDQLGPEGQIELLFGEYPLTDESRTKL